MNLDEKVRYIKNAKDENKLIIFVGAGISKNSNLPNWEELIEEFITKLNYPISKDKKLSTDDYLKIPQYYYNMYGIEKYKKIIEQKLDVKRQPNDIHELIFRLNPKHIITTNYDRLIEDTVIEQRMLFDIISEDKNFLDAKKSNYIIKMHGDIKDLDNIVLKENDYLNYSQNHILIETYIKSLLVSNTFLFIGYSLNDYNLKQIISWVDYLAESYTNINDRPKNFIVQEIDEKYNEFIQDYYKKNNLFIINPNEIDNEYLDNISTNLANEFGKRLYGTLMYINEYPHAILDKLYYGCIRFKNIKRVSIYDLSKIYSFNYPPCLLGGNTLNLFDITENEYLILNDIVNKKNKKESFVKEVLIKAGIEHIIVRRNQKIENYSLLNDCEKIEDEVLELKELEIQCNYLEIKKRINFIKDKNVQAYYLFILQEFDESIKCLESLKENILNRDIYELLLYKLNLAMINQLVYCNSYNNYKDFKFIYNNIAKNTMYELNYLKDISSNNKKQLLELSKLKNEHIRKYLKLDNSIYFGNIKQDLYKIITIVYNHYFYIKNNKIFLDYFNNINVFFDPFVEAILSTYSSKTMRVRDEFFSLDFNKHEKYILNKYDLDIIIKYSKYKNLKRYLEEYEVKELKLEKNVDILKVFFNLTKYIKLYINRYNIEYFKIIMLILSKINLNLQDVNKIVQMLEDLLINKENNLNLYIFTEIIEPLNEFLNKNKKNINKNSFEIIINELFTSKIYEDLNIQSNTKAIFSFLNCVSYFSYDLYKKKIDNIIYENNLDYILGLNNQLTKEQQKNAKEILLKNIDTIDVNFLIKFIFQGIIDYSITIENKIISKLDLYVSNKINNPLSESIPDPLSILLDNIIILHLLENSVDLSKFKKYIKYNDVLNFIIDSNNFDYEKITFSYNWINVMKEEKYLKIIINNAKSIVSKKLKFNIDNGFADEKQTRLYYKYFEIENT